MCNMDSINKKKKELEKIESEIDEDNENEPYDHKKNIEQIKKLKKCYELTKEIEQELLSMITIIEAENIMREKFNKS